MPRGDYQKRVDSQRDTFKFAFNGIVAVASVVTAAPTLARLASVADRYGWVVPGLLIGAAVLLILVGRTLAPWAMNIQPESDAVLRATSDMAERSTSRRFRVTPSIQQALEDRRRNEPGDPWQRPGRLADDLEQARKSLDEARERSRSPGADPAWANLAEAAEQDLLRVEADLGDLVASVQWVQMRARMRAAYIAISVAATVSVGSVITVVLQTPTAAKP